MSPQLEQFEDDGTFPNSRLPLLLYPQALEHPSPEAVERLFKKNGWPPAWRATVFTYHHYHSKSHECLGIATGHATLQVGGPAGREFKVAAGDVVVIPAGVAHKRILSSTDFLVVGCYPPGQEDWDLLRGNPDDRPKADENIARVALPKTDPVEGAGGALLQHWN